MAGTEDAGEKWIFACRTEQVPLEDVVRFDYQARTFVVIHSADREFFVMDGHCSHEKIHLADGLVDGNIIECPRHAGTFDYRTGESRQLPACVDLRTYRVKVENGEVFVWL